MSKFAQLLGELNTERAAQDELLTKSLAPATDDKTIAAAAAEGDGATGGEGGDPEKKKEGEGDGAGGEGGDPKEKKEGEGDGAGGEGGDPKEKKEGEGDGAGTGEEMNKSLTLATGEEVVDATEMLKSLNDQLSEHDDLLLKALPQLLGMVQSQSKVIVQQGEMLKSLNDKITVLSGQGAGRKAVVAISQKVDTQTDVMAKSDPQGITQEEFMLKANNAFDKNLISGVELTTIDVCLRSGQAVSPALINKVANS